MKKLNKILLILLMAITINNYSQEISLVAKQSIMDRLSDTTSWTTRSSALSEISKYNVTEAESILINQIWTDSLFLQPDYLKTLNAINSEITLNYTNIFLSKIDSLIMVEGNIINYLRYRVYAISVLYSNGKYSRVNQIFELVEAEKPELDLTALSLMKVIIQNIPEYEEQAKNELIRVIENDDLGWNRIYAMYELEEMYGADAIPQMAYMFVNDEDPSNRLTVLLELLVKYKYSELNDLLRQQLVNEVVFSYRIDIAEKLLEIFGSPSDYNYVKNYILNEQDETARFLIESEVESFTPIMDSSITTTIMLDTLTSYTNQCYNYEWLKDEAYKTELLNKLTEAKNKLTAGDSTGCRTEVVAFQNSVNQVYQDSAGSYPKYVSNEGYKFLYYYAGYILDRLPLSFPPNDIDAKVKAKVIKKKNGYLKYKY